MSEPNAAWPLGTVTVLGAHILDVLGRPVETIPPGQGSVRLQEIRATAAGTAAGTGVDLAKLGARVLAAGALGDDLLGDIVIAAMAGHGVDTAGLVRKKGAQTSATILPIRPNGDRPAFHVPGATRLFTRADVDLERLQDSRALLIGAPDALAGLTGEELADVARTAKSQGALVAVDVLHPGRRRHQGRAGARHCRGGRDLRRGRLPGRLAGQRRTGKTARPAGRGGRHHRLRRRLHRRPARRAAGRGQRRRRRLARPRLRCPGRDRPGLGRRDRGPGPGTGLPRTHAAGRGRPDQGPD